MCAFKAKANTALAPQALSTLDVIFFVLVADKIYLLNQASNIGILV
jgi:hypothetical protein